MRPELLSTPTQLQYVKVIQTKRRKNNYCRQWLHYPIYKFNKLTRLEGKQCIETSCVLWYLKTGINNCSIGRINYMFNTSWKLWGLTSVSHRSMTSPRGSCYSGVRSKTVLPQPTRFLGSQNLHHATIWAGQHAQLSNAALILRRQSATLK